MSDVNSPLDGILSTNERDIVDSVVSSLPFEVGGDIDLYIKSLSRSIRRELKQHGKIIAHNNKHLVAFLSSLKRELSITPTTEDANHVPTPTEPMITEHPYEEESDEASDDVLPRFNSNVLKKMRTEIAKCRTWVAKQEVYLRYLGVPQEIKEDDLYCSLPMDIQSVANSKGLYISRAEKWAGYKHKIKMGYIEVLGGKEKEKYVTICIGKSLFKEGSLPDRVEKLRMLNNAGKQRNSYYKIYKGEDDVTVSFEDLQKNSYADRLERMGVANTTTNGIMAAIIDLMSEEIIALKGADKTGWHKIGEKWLYLHRHGAIQTGVDTKDIPNMLYTGEDVKDHLKEAYVEWYDNALDFSLEKSCKALEYTKELYKTNQQGLILLSNYAAGLSRSIRTNKFKHGHPLILTGPSGGGKTTTLTLAANIGKPSDYDGSLDMDASGTIPSVEKRLHRNADSVHIIDDIERVDGERAKILALLDNIAKKSYNGLPFKDRQTCDMSDKEGYTCNSYPVMSGITFFPDLPEGANRRILYVFLDKNEISLEEGEFNLTEAHDTHASNYGGIGVAIIQKHADRLNSSGLAKYADERKTKRDTYAKDLRKSLKMVWSETHDTPLPQIGANLLKIGGMILLGAEDIDDVTQGLCKVVETIFNPLVKTLYKQLMLLNGEREVDGLSLLQFLLTEYHNRIIEGISVNGAYHCVVSTKTGKPPEGMRVTVNGKEVSITKENFKHKRADESKNMLTGACVTFDDNCTLEGSYYLTTAGKKALLTIAKEYEHTKHMVSENKLSELADIEGFLMRKGEGNQRDDRFRLKGGSQQRGLHLKLSKVLPCIVDVQSLAEEDKEESNNAKAPTQLSKGIELTIENQPEMTEVFKKINPLTTKAMVDASKKGGK